MKSKYFFSCGLSFPGVGDGPLSRDLSLLGATLENEKERNLYVSCDLSVSFRGRDGDRFVSFGSLPYLNDNTKKTFNDLTNNENEKRNRSRIFCNQSKEK